jgi:hypothetical protein
VAHRVYRSLVGGEVATASVRVKAQTPPEVRGRLWLLEVTKLSGAAGVVVYITVEEGGVAPPDPVAKGDDTYCIAGPVGSFVEIPLERHVDGAAEREGGPGRRAGRLVDLKLLAVGGAADVFIGGANPTRSSR